MPYFSKRLLFVVLFSAVLLLSSWGFLVHRTVNQLAIYELPVAMKPFFYNNREYLVYNAPRPDIRRSKDRLEADKHFINLEDFEHNGVHDMPLDWNTAVKKYSKDSLLKNGYVPYYVIFMKGKLTDAFKSQNKDSILFYAADIGHYIADANVPLHTTNNYDGQLTNQKGMHSLWESMIPEIEIANYTLYSKHTAKYLSNPEKTIWTAVRNAAALVPEVFATEKKVSLQFSEAQKFRTQIRKGKEYKSYTSEFAKAYATALKSTINDQLLHSADMIADFYYTAWVDAGKPNLQSLNSNWTSKEQLDLKESEKTYKSNQLIQQKMLLSKIADVKEEN